MRIALIFLALAGCAASTASNVTADTAPQAPAPKAPPAPGADAYRAAIQANEERFRASSLTAGLGEDASADGMTVRPLEVVEDSRCPIDVTCVWAGRVRLRVRISGDGFSGESVMEIGRPVAIIARDGRLVLEPASEHPSYQQLTLVAMSPLRWAHPPAGVDPQPRPRFAFSLID